MKKKINEKIHGKPDVRIGKNGLTDNVIQEIKRRLKEHDIIKVKINQNLIKQGVDRRELAKEIAEKTNALILDVRGYTITMKRKGSRENQ